MLARVIGADRNSVHVSGLTVDGASVRAAGKPLDDGRVYTVAAAAHVVQDHLLGRAGVEILSDAATDATVRDMVIAHLRGRSPLRNAVEPRIKASRLPSPDPGD
jgi:hypothetical protein